MLVITPIGANVIYHYEDEPTREIASYVSFGHYNEEANIDTYGVCDDYIYFYFPNGEKELLDYIKFPSSEFRITSYELVYSEQHATLVAYEVEA